MERLKRTSA